MLETVQLVLDRPRDGAPDTLVYVAEAVLDDCRVAIAASPVFRPLLDVTAHRAALAKLEADLRADGWQRENSGQRGLIGVRFHRWRDDTHR